MNEILLTFTVCFLPGLCLGYAACSIRHNRRLTRRYPRLNIENL